MASASRVVLAVCALTLLGAAAWAEGEAEAKARQRRERLAAQFDGHDRWALLVGINECDDPKMAPLRFCVSDAKLMAKTLVDHCAYPAKNVIVLGDGEPPERLPTRENIHTHVLRLLKGIAPGDTVLLFFACHGGNHGGQPLLVCRDYSTANPGLTGVRVDHIRDWLHDSSAGQKLLVLDCCHSGAARGGTGALGITGDDLEGHKGPGGLITFAACRASQVSQEDQTKAHGFFSYCLARGLGGEADTNGDGIVDSDEVFGFTHFEVGELARARGAEQTPVRIMGEDVVGVFALARVRAEPGGRPGSAPVVGEVTPGRRVANSLGMEFGLVMPGGVTLGSPADEAGRDADEGLWKARLRRPYFLGATEVTQAQWTRVMGANPSWFAAGGGGAKAVEGLDTSDLPVEQVSWADAVEFCRRLSALPEERAAGVSYRLPTEAEWEYACRAGTTTPFHTGPLLSPAEANVDGTKPYLAEPGPALGRTAKVASYPPNAWGLHDMHGNVWEWVSDWYDPARGHKDVYGGGDKDSGPPPDAEKLSKIGPQDETGPETGTHKVLRGGAYSGDVALCRSASRRDRLPDTRHRTVGLRVVRVAGELGGR